MSKGPMMPFGGKARASEAERAVEPAPPAPRPQQPAPQRIAEQPAIKTILGPGCVVEGKLVCAGPTQLDGKVAGELVADDFLIIDRNATVLADLDVQEVVVRGAVKGNIKASRRVTLEETAQVEGDVAAPAVEMRIGAQMSGKIDVIHRARESAAAPAQPKEPAYQPHLHQQTPAYQQQPFPPPSQASAAQPGATPREASPAFVAFDDGADRSGF